MGYTVANLGPRFGYTSDIQLKQFEVELTKVVKKKLTFTNKKHTIGVSKAYAQEL